MRWIVRKKEFGQKVFLTKLPGAYKVGVTFVETEFHGGAEGSQQNKRKRDKECMWSYKVVFGLPWECEQFIHKACLLGHPAKQNHAVPKDLKEAIAKHVEWSDKTLVEYRMHWCRRWLRRAKELEQAEKEDAAKRPAHVRTTTACKRLLLTQEMLESIEYEDMEVLELLRCGSPLAGEIPKSCAF